MSNVCPYLVSLYRGPANREERGGVVFYRVLSDSSGEAMAQGLGRAMLEGILPVKPFFIEAIEALANQTEMEERIVDPDPEGHACGLCALPAWHPSFWNHLQEGGEIVWRALDFDGMKRWATEEPADAEWLLGRMRHGENAGELAENALAFRFMEFVEQAPIRAAIAESEAAAAEARPPLRL